ncbi:OmpA family protein [Pontibacter sp. E15-1]|uniref:OmpA family protein n=1 Tax=Pontibacter sp. E15-1 TaxID=2919918 RepID=UPI001F4F2724|nr:OmpA family protein [Pontibacter sp. E15-1]MCJ8166461.1 OmpA family protein [Pontibacter sp. E15-1]
MNQLAKSFSRFSMLLVFICLLAASAMGQSTRKQLRAANKFFDKENYREALPLYEQVLASDQDNAEALFRAGVSYMTFDKEKAADYLYRAQKLKPKVDRDLEYWLGRVDHINYRFDSAIEHFQTYQKDIPKRNDERRAEVAQLIQYAKNAKRETANPKDVFVNNLGDHVNTAYSEHSPVISSDYNYLLFTSRSSASTGGQEAQDGEYYEDIFETNRVSTDEWEKPRSVPGALNSRGHDASIQLFDNDTKLLLYQSENNGDIMVSERQSDGTWGAPKSISDKVNSRDFESDAYITPDGTTLFYSTNHYSENGDLNIYMIQRIVNGTWGTPKSLGNTINTEFDDDSPYLASDGTLYFSSRGHNSMGGYDIFSAKYDSVARRWARPVNLGSPINTPDDDTYYRLSPDGSYAYLSSYRIGGYGEKDIYTISYIKNTGLKGQVFTKADSILVPGVELIFNGLQADKRPISYRDVTKPDSASFNVQVLSGRKYQVQLSRDGRVIETQEIEVPAVITEAEAITQNFYIDFIDTTGVLAPGTYAMKPVYFDLDEYDLRAESITELENILRIMKANPTINISIEGHTDARATDGYNMTLGQNRADAAYDYLVGKGISPKRLVTVTYGERRPAVPNTSEENMQLNRRTEFKVLPRQDDAVMK